MVLQLHIPMMKLVSVFVLSNPFSFLCGQVKADRHSKKLSVLQHASRNVNEMAANVVASTRTGQENLEEKGELRLISVSTLYTLRSIGNR